MAPPSVASNPYPGLRPFRSEESSLFFGREEQCDELLVRLATHKLVAVVGSSGSGKSSVVQAGLLPALDRGYLPEGGAAWHVATFRPGGSPLANLIDAIVHRRLPVDTAPRCTGAEIENLLRATSLGLATAATRMLGPGESLVVVADQFEEIFRFRGLNAGSSGDEEAVDCVNLLIEAARADAPVFVVITMRSDYLGDCARFARLPAALNDTQFLVPRMSRQQLRAAIEGPAAVRKGVVAGPLVQQLLHDIERLGVDAAHGRITTTLLDVQQDQLPILQHTLARLWSIASAIPGKPVTLDLRHYENAPIQTVEHALDNHAEAVFRTLTSDPHRSIARLIFQRLTERDAAGREIRRPVAMRELTELCAAQLEAGESASDAVQHVVGRFAALGNSFLTVNSRQEVDISHESLIRRWSTLRKWVEAETESRRIFARLAEAGAGWQRSSASLYRGPELAEATRWWKSEKPTASWASRYNTSFDIARRFLEKSNERHLLLQVFQAFALVSVLATVVVLYFLYTRALSAEQAASSAEHAMKKAREELNLVNRDYQEIIAKQEDEIAKLRRGDVQGANIARSRTDDIQKQASTRNILTENELSELTRLRRLEGQWKVNASTVAQLSAEKQDWSTEKTTLTAESEKLSARVNELENQNKKLDSMNRGLAESIKGLEGKLRMLDSELAELRKRYQYPGAAPPLNSVTAQTEKEVQRVLQGFASAYESGRVEEIRRYYPTFDTGQANTLKQALRDLKDFQLVITVRTTLLSPSLSRGVVEAVVEESFVAGASRVRNPRQTRWYYVAKEGDQWVIVGHD